MDYLPKPLNPAFLPPEVPYLSSELSPFHYKYDKKGWLTYPERMGFDIIELDRLREELVPWDDYPGTKSAEETACFLQEWLFFGLLIAVFEVLGEPLDPNDFILRSENGKHLITTIKLPCYLRNLFQCVRHLGHYERAEKQKEICSFYFQTRTLMPQTDLFLVPLSLEVAASISLMVTALAYTTHWAFNGDVWPIFNFGGSGLFAKRLVSSGWCLGEIFELWHNIFSPSFYYVSLLGPRQIQRDHTGCTQNECLALTVGDNNYDTPHVACCSSCGDLIASIDRICLIIESGRIPLVYVSGTDITAPYHIKVLEAQPGQRFVAISHLWADKLGNPRRNSLPECRLLQLQARVNNIYDENSSEFSHSQVPGHPFESDSSENSYLGGGRVRLPVPFWIDTLCIPITQSGETRRRAISQMNDIYRQAEKVLVLDAELMLQSRELSPLELLVRITTSNWMKRVWTLAEGTLANNLVFQFADGLVTRDVYQQLEDIWRGQLKDSWKDLKAPPLVEFHVLVELSNTGGFGRKQSLFVHPTTISSILNNIGRRSTAHRRDELICIAIMAGFDRERLDELQSTPEQERQKKFIDLQKYFPSEIIFLAEPRMQQQGYRWAPWSLTPRNETGERTTRFTTFVSGHHPSILPLADFDGSGLLVKFVGMRLSITKAPPPSFLFVQDEEDKTWYKIVLSQWNDLAMHQFENPAIILRNRVNPTNPSPGALVEIEEPVGDMIQARFVTVIYVYNIEQESHVQQVLDGVKDEGEGDISTGGLRTKISGSCTIFKLEQTWHVG